MKEKINEIEKSIKFLLVSILFLTVAFSLYVDNIGRDFLSFMLAFCLVINVYMIGKLMIKKWKILENKQDKGE